ncbi:MAG: cupin domain-containing protein [Moraxellaceae bacterium]|nr:cupin domain-containing protein [Moraxellaceae bacterium]
MNIGADIGSSRRLAHTVITPEMLQVANLPGIEHRTLADAGHGLRHLSVWQQTLAPGAATPPHRHDTEEVVICHSGRGELHMDGKVHRFGPHAVVLIPPDVPHQIFSVGSQPMECTAIFATGEVEVYGSDDERMVLPW